MKTKNAMRITGLVIMVLLGYGKGIAQDWYQTGPGGWTGEPNDVGINIYTDDDKSVGLIGTYSKNKDFGLYTVDADAWWRIRLICKYNTGNVGIGTLNPATKFHVNGDMRVVTGGVQAFNINSNANVGIGTASPISRFHVLGDVRVESMDGVEALNISDEANVGLGIAPTKGKLHVKGSIHVENDAGDQTFHVSAGKQLVFIGKDAWDQFEASQDDAESPLQEYADSYALWVSQGIVTEDISLVNVEDWSDYVFEDHYTLNDLEQVDAFIKANGHLPNMPSEEAVKKEGYSMHTVNKKLLEKIEELTLYTIEQHKQIKAQAEEIATIKAQAAEIAVIKAQLAEMQQK